MLSADEALKTVSRLSKQKNTHVSFIQSRHLPALSLDVCACCDPLWVGAGWLQAVLAAAGARGACVAVYASISLGWGNAVFTSLGIIVVSVLQY